MMLYLNIILTIIALILGGFLFLSVYSLISRIRTKRRLNKMTKEDKIDFRTFDFRQISNKLKEIKDYYKKLKY